MEQESWNVFISLVRLGIGYTASSLPERINWESVEVTANEHGLSAIVLDGIEKLSVECRPPQAVLLNWIGEALQSETIYAGQRKAAVEMAGLFQTNHIRTYVLKGAVVAECYPKPERRVSSDMDCFLLPDARVFDAWSLGNDLIKSKGYKVNTDFYKNSAFYLPGLIVENHQYLTPFRGNKNLASFEKVLQDLLRQDKGEDRLEGTYLYRPPVMVSALFLIEHAYSHFLHEGLTWRMVLDWVMFSRKHEKDVVWCDFDVLVEEFGFKQFYDCYVRLGKYLLGEIKEADLTIVDKKMLADVWAPLDLHETLHGVKAKMQLAGNYWRARWKYKYFTNMNWVRALFEWVTGAVFNRYPTLN